MVTYEVSFIMAWFNMQMMFHYNVIWSWARNEPAVFQWATIFYGIYTCTSIAYFVVFCISWQRFYQYYSCVMPIYLWFVWIMLCAISLFIMLIVSSLPVANFLLIFSGLPMLNTVQLKLMLWSYFLHCWSQLLLAKDLLFHSLLIS